MTMIMSYTNDHIILVTEWQSECQTMAVTYDTPTITIVNNEITICNDDHHISYSDYHNIKNHSVPMLGVGVSDLHGQVL
jgi:hypothetical protein